MRRVATLAAVLAATAGCAGCTGDRRGPAPERLLPADVRAAVILPEVGRAARELAALHATASTFPGTGELAQARGMLAAQLGFDPLDPEALAGAGIDRRRGAAVALLAGPAEAPPRWLLVLPASDVPRLEALLLRLARERLGAEARSAEARGGASVVVVRRALGDPPALAYAVVARTVLVAAGPEGPAAVGAAAALAPEGALAAAPAFAAARRALGDGDAVLVFLPPGAPALAGLAPLREGAALGLSGAEGRLRARAAILAVERAAALRALAGGGAAARLAARLAPGSTLVVRWDGEPAALGRHVLPLVPARDRSWLAARGFDLDRDLLALLAPGGAAAFSLAPDLDLAGLSAETLRADPLALVGFEAVLPVRDAAAAEEAAARLARALGRDRAPAARGGGLDPSSADRPERSARAAGAESKGPGPEPDPDRQAAPLAPVHRVPTPSGLLAWTIDPTRRRAVAAGGAPGRLEALLSRLGGAGDGFAAPTEASRGALSGGLGGAVLDPPRLVASVRALPPEAFGGGPSGFVLRSVVNRFVDPAERLLAVSLRADLAEGALLLTLELEARPRVEAGP